jgi:CO/xanthine dehydrogenase FAD-binding subunit
MDLNTIDAIARPRKRSEIPSWRSSDAWLAGGTWLFSEPQPQLTRLIDITDLGWPAVEIDDAGLHIGATCKIAELDAVALPSSWTVAPLINQCCRSFLASFKIWNVATVGGNLCMALPAGPMISLTAALEGVCTIWTPDGSERRLTVTDFVLGPRQTALNAGELLRRVDLPFSALHWRTSFRQISLAPLGRSAALLIGAFSPDGGSFALTVTAATPRPIRLQFPMIPTSSALRERLDFEIPQANYYSDVGGTPAWRRQVTLQLADEIRAELASYRAGAR